MEDSDIPMSVAIGVISGILSGVTVALSSGSQKVNISPQLGGIVAGVTALVTILMIIMNQFYKFPKKKKLTKEDWAMFIVLIILAIVLYVSYIYNAQKIFWLFVGIFIGIGIIKLIKNYIK